MKILAVQKLGNYKGYDYILEKTEDGMWQGKILPPPPAQPVDMPPMADWGMAADALKARITSLKDEARELVEKEKELLLNEKPTAAQVKALKITEEPGLLEPKLDMAPAVHTEGTKFFLGFVPVPEQLADLQAYLGVNWDYNLLENSIIVYTQDPITLDLIQKELCALNPVIGGWQSLPDTTALYRRRGKTLAVLENSRIDLYNLDSGAKVHENWALNVQEADLVMADWLDATEDFPEAEELLSEEFAATLNKKYPDLWGELCTNNWKKHLDAALKSFFGAKHTDSEVAEYLKQFAESELKEIRENIMTL